MSANVNNPNLSTYTQADIQTLYASGSIVPNIDSYGNLVIQNTTGQLFLTAITLPLVGEVYNSIKVETKIDPAFYEL